MWISAKRYQEIIEARISEAAVLNHQLGEIRGINAAVSVENIRMRADLDWFKLRLNQVEKERAQLILSATGTPMPVATFAPAQDDPSQALNEMPEFAMVGADAPDDYPGVNQLSPDMMPGRTRN